MGGCLSSDSGPAVPNVAINMAAEPQSDQERKIADSAAKLLEKAPEHLQQLQEYKGCEKYIRTALADPTPETEKQAWHAVEKAVDVLYKFYKYGLGIEAILQDILPTVCASADPVAAVQSNQTLVRQLCEIFHFAFRFDELKMVNPAIQNDFSYYRRVLSRMRSGAVKMNEEGGKKKGKKGKKAKEEPEDKVTEEIANKMSFFFAYPTPMMRVILDTTRNITSSAQLIPGLALIANVACNLVETNAVGITGQGKMLLLCGMTGCIILVDHLEPNGGAFHKKSPVRIKNCITLLKNFTEQSTDFLLNSLRFTTLHLNDDSTIPAVQKLMQ